MTTPEIIDQFNLLILEDRRISAKSIVEQLDISRERVGSIVHEVLDMRKLSPKCVPKCLNAVQKRKWCQRFVIFFCAIQNISCHNWWPRTKPSYVTMTRRQSNNQWSGGIAAYSTQNFRVQKSVGNVLAWIFWGPRRHPPHWLSSKGPNYPRGVLLISPGALEGHFERKTTWSGHQGRFVLARQCSHRALTTGKKLAYLGFRCLDHPPYSPDLAPSDYQVFPGLKKTIESSPFFVRRGHCCRGDLVRWSRFCLFFWVACKR